MLLNVLSVVLKLQQFSNHLGLLQFTLTTTNKLFDLENYVVLLVCCWGLVCLNWIVIEN